MTMALTAFEVYKTEKQNVVTQQNNKNKWKLYALLKIFSNIPQSRTQYFEMFQDFSRGLIHQKQRGT